VKGPATPKAAKTIPLQDEKPKVPAKARKAAAPKKAMATVTPIDINRETASLSVSLIDVSPEQIARLAHQYWLARGCQHGHDADDWFRAEQELRSKAS
jgi:hypothetical protein